MRATRYPHGHGAACSRSRCGWTRRRTGEVGAALPGSVARPTAEAGQNADPGKPEPLPGTLGQAGLWRTRRPAGRTPAHGAVGERDRRGRLERLLALPHPQTTLTGAGRPGREEAHPTLAVVEQLEAGLGGHARIAIADAREVQHRGAGA